MKYLKKREKLFKLYSKKMFSQYKRLENKEMFGTKLKKPKKEDETEFFKKRKKSFTSSVFILYYCFLLLLLLLVLLMFTLPTYTKGKIIYSSLIIKLLRLIFPHHNQRSDERYAQKSYFYDEKHINFFCVYCAWFSMVGWWDDGMMVGFDVKIRKYYL